ncbi:MAG: site-specific integrase [Clostridia bacterium]|nr:site-specific integrase [Clostridia bacterium]
MTASISLTTYIAEWLTTFKETTVKQSTYDRLLTSARALEEYDISNKPIGEITCVDIQRYVNDLTKRGYSLTTIKKQMRIVTAPLKQASALHIIPADPGVGIRLPSRYNVLKPERLIEAYNDKEQTALLDVLSRGQRKGYPAIALMIETGLRVGEVLALRWQDVQLSRKRINVRNTVVRLANKKQSFVQDSVKSESSRRSVPLTPTAICLLEDLFVTKRSEWVFTNSDGERLSYEALRYQTRKACTEAGIEYRGEHVFRHTFATNCYHRGIDVKILSRLLGHADVNITYNLYIHLYGDGFDEMYDALVGTV